jgi:hypothetical protein
MIGCTEVIPDEQQRRGVRLGERIGKRIAVVQHAAGSHAPAELDSRPQGSLRLVFIDRSEDDAGGVEERVEVLDRLYAIGPKPSGEDGPSLDVRRHRHDPLRVSEQPVQ